MVIDLPVLIGEQKKIIGRLCKPEAKEVKAAVLFIHGWQSHKDEVGDLFKKIANDLAMNGIISLRYDSEGCGESNPEKSRNLTIGSMLNDAKIALNYLDDSISREIPIGLCGFSMGAAVMALLTLDFKIITKNPLKSIVGISPLVNLIKDFSFRHEKLIKRVQELPLSNNEPLGYDLGWKKIEVLPALIREFDNLQDLILDAWNRYTQACLVIGGELDYSGATVKSFDKVCPNACNLKNEYLDKADHILNILSPAHSKELWAVKKISEWFQKTL